MFRLRPSGLVLGFGPQKFGAGRHLHLRPCLVQLLFFYNDKMHAASPYGLWRGVSMGLMALWHRAAG